MKQRTQKIRNNRAIRLMKSNWLFNASKKGNQTEREKRTSNCINNEFD